MTGPDERFSVVIADDVEGLRRLVRIILEDSGRFDVVGEAADGIEAVEAVRSLKPDLILLDLSMPRLGGLPAMPLIREASPKTRIVVISGFAQARLGEESRAKGAVGYIEKGTTPEEFTELLLAAATKVIEETP